VEGNRAGIVAGSIVGGGEGTGAGIEGSRRVIGRSGRVFGRLEGRTVGSKGYKAGLLLLVLAP